MNHYTLSEIECFPTLSTSQADDLKIDTGDHRVWLSRCGVEDGEPYPNKITIERLINGSWQTADEYEAL